MTASFATASTNNIYDSGFNMVAALYPLFSWYYLTMDTVYYVPTPKTKAKDCTRDDRLKIHTLYNYAGYKPADICLQLNLTLDQVYYALSHRLTPQKKRCGRPTLLDTPRRKQLIAWVTASKANRETQWVDIPAALGWTCGEKAIRNAFKKEGYVRRKPRRKPPLSESHKEARLVWAWEHLFWSEEQWFNVIWSDETWVQPGKHKKTFITRKIGESEVYHEDCVEARYQKKIGWMFWGSISGISGKEKGVFWEKAWGSINERSYSARILPLIADILEDRPQLLFQQDNASGHASRYTMGWCNCYSIKPVFWPANSPDLNPIETLWDIMKDYIQRHYPEVHRSYSRLRRVVQEAWDSITHETIKDIIRTMGDRCIQVILAQGGCTEY
jgi:transposase